MAVVTKIETINGAGNSKEYRLPAVDNPRCIGMVHVDSGTVNYSVQYTLDGTRWKSLEDDLEGLTDTEDFTIVFPILAVRVVVFASDGAVTLTLRYDDKGFS